MDGYYSNSSSFLPLELDVRWYFIGLLPAVKSWMYTYLLQIIEWKREEKKITKQNKIIKNIKENENKTKKKISTMKRSNCEHGIFYWCASDVHLRWLIIKWMLIA